MTFLDHRGQPFHTIESFHGNSRLAVFYPGANYTPMAPLFFYLGNALEQLGWDVLAIDYRYSENADFLAVSDAEKDSWRHQDSLVLGRQVGEVTVLYKHTAFVGKSLGTRFLLSQWKANLISPEADLVWATPDKTAEELYALLPKLANRSLLVYGTADHQYEKARADGAKGLPRVSVLEMPGVGHGFETAGDTRQSILNIADAVDAIAAFLDDH